MANKYVFAEHTVHEAIHNMVQLKKIPKDIANECFAQYHLEVALNDVSYEMLLKMYELLANQCWFDTYGNYDYIY